MSDSFVTSSVCPEPLKVLLISCQNGAALLSKKVWNNSSRLSNTKLLIYKTAAHLRTDEALCDTPLA